jgi:hypothetical protein
MLPEKKISRNKFVVWTLSIGAMFSLPFFLKKKKSETKKFKMLSEDGKLVEIDASRIPTKKVKIADRDIHTWLKKPKT